MAVALRQLRWRGLGVSTVAREDFSAGSGRAVVLVLVLVLVVYAANKLGAVPCARCCKACAGPKMRTVPDCPHNGGACP